MYNEFFFMGRPYPYKNLCKVYPPTVNQIIDSKSAYSKILTISQEEIEDLYVEKQIQGDIPSPFLYLFIVSYNNKDTEALIKNSFEFFTKEKITFLYEQKLILIGDIKAEDVKSIDDLRLMKEEDFFDFQNLVREAMGEKKIAPPVENEDPRIKKMKAKARYRDKIKAKRGGGLSFSSILISICCMGLGINPLNIGEISYAAIPALMRYYQEKEKYETDIKSLLAGADSKK